MSYEKWLVAIKSVCPKASQTTHGRRLVPHLLHSSETCNRIGSQCVHTSFNICSPTILHVRFGGIFPLTRIFGSSLK